MTTVVIMPGGFHPFHPGHLALYQSAQQAFPDAEVYVAATNDKSDRPFDIADKQKIAYAAGVEPGHFVQVKSPFRAEEIAGRYTPNQDVLIFVRSEKDANTQPLPGGVKKDGSASYLQPYDPAHVEPFARHAYMDYLPTVEFGPGAFTSATQIRTAWPTLTPRRKLALVMSLYPSTQQDPAGAKDIVRIFDQTIGGVTEAKMHFTDPLVRVNLYYVTPKLQAQGKIQNVAHNIPYSTVQPLIDRLMQKYPSMNAEYLVVGPTDKSQYGQRLKEDLDYIEEDQIDPLTAAAVNFYQNEVGDVHKQPVDNYKEIARELLQKTDNPGMRKKIMDILVQGNKNPYIQGGVITTVGALLAGGILSSAAKVGLTPQQTNILLQAILNTVIPTMVSRVNGKSWRDTLKYTLASAGIGTSIAAMTESGRKKK